MSDVKWIKIVVDVFDDEKIRYIETLPNGDTTIVIWFRLLCLAGKSNRNGVLMMTDRIAYTEDMLSSIFNRDIKAVQLALDIFEKLEMIEVFENRIYIPNWEKHQNGERLEKIREQTLARVKKYQEKKKIPQLSLKSVNQALIKREINATELELEEDKELDNKDIAKKLVLGQFKNVKLTQDEYDRLKKEQSDIDNIIDWFSAYIVEKGYKSKSHNLTIRRWVIDAYRKDNKRVEPIPDYTQENKMTEEEIEKLKERLKMK